MAGSDARSGLSRPMPCRPAYWEILTIGPVMVPWPLRLRLPWPAAFGGKNIFFAFFSSILLQSMCCRKEKEAIFG